MDRIALGQKYLLFVGKGTWDNFRGINRYKARSYRWILN
jgi:hypothetical protein